MCSILIPVNLLFILRKQQLSPFSHTEKLPSSLVMKPWIYVISSLMPSRS
ncbi:unnamed protein product [Schistosoma curassoni]|uniref:Uncharacterized protein n=1 Tax=Schistosoma curassoni TaxID=6186 RepID=A0A183L484_9TREM|nr:unnamed protein product [Schistosoma curassoni]